MPLVSMKEILVEARAGQYAVGAFEVWSLDSVQAVVEAAEAAEMPVILQAGQLECDYAGGVDTLAEVALRVIGKSSVPAALHLDHAEGIGLVRQAIDAGFNSVMIDASALPFAQNAAMTREVVGIAGPRGVSVEGELGSLAGAEGNTAVDEAEAMQTDPEEAVRFVEQTGVDFLAVAIGTAHGVYRFPPKINIPRLKRIASRVSLPLVLHGGSGTPDEHVVETIRHGIAKINICTEFLMAYGDAARISVNDKNFTYSVPAFFGPQKAAGRQRVYEKIRLFSNGRAK